MPVLEYFMRVFNERVIRSSSKFAFVSALLAGIFKYTDDDLKWDYLKDILPNSGVFQIFASSTSFFLVFRSVQSFNMHREGARNVFQMTGSWFDSASTLMAFTRGSTANEQDVLNFRSTLIRLYSLLSMLCLTELEHCEDADRSQAMNFNILDLGKLDRDVLELIKSSKCKVEVVAQLIQCLIVDQINTGVLTVPAPILSRAFQDLGNGMLKYHETLNISHTPSPFPLKAMTALLLLLTAVYAPLMMAIWNRSITTAAWTTFVQVLVFFTLNNLAEEVENPFGGDMNDVDIQSLHHDMNQRLLELHRLSHGLSPKRIVSRSSGLSSHSTDLLDFEDGFDFEEKKSRQDKTRATEKSLAMSSVIDKFIRYSTTSNTGATPRASQTNFEGPPDTNVVLARGSTGLYLQWPDLPPDLEQECTTSGRMPEATAVENSKLRKQNDDTEEDVEIPQDFHGFGPNSHYLPTTPPLTPCVSCPR